MLVSYSQEGSVSQAVTDTFSGEKPCSLCEKIASVKAAAPEPEQNETPLPSLSAKLFQDLFPPSIPALRPPFSTPLPEAHFASPRGLLSPPSFAPPTPPPRC